MNIISGSINITYNCIKLLVSSFLFSLRYHLGLFPGLYYRMIRLITVFRTRHYLANAQGLMNK